MSNDPVIRSHSARSPWALTPHFSSPSAAPDVRWYMNLRRIRPIYLANSPTTKHKPRLIFGGCIRVYELPYGRIANLPQDSPSRIFKNASEARTFFRSDVLRTSQVTQPISAQLWLYKRIWHFHLQAFSAYRDASGQSF